ncbi:MAG TPA: folate-binding protein [Streptosporangiaceae bacterium]|nr:folate-binding protein [Streptosporangiaceae bacterium]
MQSSPLLTAPGAVAADGADAGIAAHYGDPFAEQRALAGALGLVDRSHRGVILIAGQDRLSWLHSLTTQDLEHLAPGSTAEALILSPNGHVEHHLTLTDDGTHLWAHVEPGAAASLLEFLESMRFMLRVESADVSADYAVLTVMGPDAELVPGGTTPPRAQAAEIADWTKATAAARTHAFGMDVIVPRDRLAEAAEDLQARGAVLAGIWAYEALRIAARRPRLGLDTDHRTIPHEVGWIETAVHLNKGCYRGQETVARVHNLGHPPRRLVFLHLDGSEDRLPAHGDPVSLDGTGGGAAGGVSGGAAGVVGGAATGGAVGFVGSAARHYELGPIALAMVKRTIPVDVPLLAGGLAAAQEVIVPPDAGANVKLTLRRPKADLIRSHE